MGSAKNSNAELVNLIIEDETAKLEEEEALHLLLQEKVTKNINHLSDDSFTFGQKMADKIAKFAGSWTFIIIFVSCLVLWIALNSVILIFAKQTFDKYPFILLNLILSCVAAMQAPVIMMSQNRQEEKDRLRAQNDYKTNLKSEIIIEDLHEKLDFLILNQQRMTEKINTIEEKLRQK
jgi:uncharacterized membrane protein